MSNILYPNKCIFCGKVIGEEKMICSRCVKTVLVVGENTCERCGRDVENCGCKLGDFAFARNISCFYFENSVKKLIYRFKFDKKLLLGKLIAEYMSSAIADKYKDFTFDFVTFVPSNYIKRVFKGFNSAEILARNISDELNLPVVDTLGSKFHLKSQKSMSKKLRMKKIRGRFFVKESDLKGKHILLIDDIMTTGSTLSECARVLKKAGASEISCATFAITLKK